MKISLFRRSRRRRGVVGDAVVFDDNETMVDAATSSDSDASNTSRNKSSRKKNKQRRRTVAQQQQHQEQRQRQEHLHRQMHPYGPLSDDTRSGNHQSDTQHYNEYRVAEVGSPPKRLLQRKERMTFKIHDFEHSPEKRGEYRITPTLKAHGYNWKLQIYPRGDNRSEKSSEYVSCFLHYFSSPSDKQAPVAKVEYRCGTHMTETQICTFQVQEGKCSTSWGLENFIRRDRILQNYLDESGTLEIHVDLQIAIDPKIVWYPPPMRQEPTLMQLYHSSEETADVAFRLIGVSHLTGGTPPMTAYRAHKMILALRARILYELVCESSVEDDLEKGFLTVELPGIDRHIFEAMLEHIYTVKQPCIEDESMAKELLIAADRFCLPDLKLYVESVLVDRFVTTENAANLLLLADSHSCALLKEKTIDLYVSDPQAMTSSTGWRMVEDSEKILAELLAHIHTSCRDCFDKKQRASTNENTSTHQEEYDSTGANNTDVDSNDDIEQLDVFSLREQLGEQGLDVDGSRETLVARLRNSKEKLKSEYSNE